MKLTATDGKQRESDCAKAADLLRIVQCVPSRKSKLIHTEWSGVSVKDHKAVKALTNPCAIPRRTATISVAMPTAANGWVTTHHHAPLHARLKMAWH